MASSRPAAGYIDDVFYSSGYGEVVDALLEYVPDLTWPKAGETLNRMRHDSQMSAGLRGFTLPIRRASWAVDPAGCRDQVAEEIADDLGLPILGQDAKQTGARRRGVVWGEHLRVSLLDLPFGHMAFAQEYDTSTGKARLGSLQERMPRTITKINVGADGQIESVEQNRTGNTATPPTIKRNELVWYVNDREGVAWRGQSMLRPAYPYWLIKDQMLRVHATSIRRFGMGMPYMEAPAGATPQQIDQAAKLSANWQASERSGGAGPAGFVPKLIGLTGSVPDALGFIKYLDQAIAVSLGTQLFNLGTTDTGSRAVGDVFLTLLTEQQQTLADAHALQATTQIVVPLVTTNYGENEPAPQIVCTDVGADRAVTAESLQLLLASGALSADPALEGWVRAKFRLPERDPNAPTVDDTTVKPPTAAKRRPAVKAAAAASSAPTGAAVLLMLSADDAARLHVDGGEPAADMHVTLGYLAQDADQYDEAARADLDARLTGTWTGPVTADAFATAVLNPDSAERDPASVLLVQSTELAVLHDAVTDAIGDEASTTFPTWVPHVTVAYNATTDVTDGKTGPLTFDRLVMSWGGEHTIVGGDTAAASARTRVRAGVPQTVTLRRDLTPAEAAAGTDFTAHQHDWQDALDVLVASWASVTRDQRQQLVDQVKAAVTSGTIDALADLSVDSQTAASKLAAAMIGMAKTAADEQVLEAAAQGITIAPGVADATALRARAEVYAAMLGNGLAQSALRRATQVWTPQVDASALGGSVMDYLTGLGDGALRARLGGALSSAQSAGRLSTIDLSILAGNGPALFVASEVLDDATCDNCAGVDGTTFDSFDDAQLAYGSGGYSDCLGGDACRGALLSLWDVADLDLAA